MSMTASAAAVSARLLSSMCVHVTAIRPLLLLLRTGSRLIFGGARRRRHVAVGLPDRYRVAEQPLDRFQQRPLISRYQ
jgi:hypothetical protein